jgi:formylglycine-generating enzyme required for sulfatase activity
VPTSARATLLVSGMRRFLGPCAAVLLTSACVSAPEPRGEALVVVHTDVAVPRRVNRLRVEVFDAAGLPIETRDVVTPTAADWPVSFSVILPDGVPEQVATVRLRAYLDGHEVSARDIERDSVEKPRNVVVHPSIEAACQSPPRLRLGEPLTLRRGSTPITTLLRTQGCRTETLSGSAVARLDIEEAGDYRVAIVRAVPDAANAEPGSDTAISLRRECPYPTAQVACAERISSNNRLSVLERVTLSPGAYFVVTGGLDPAPADLTLLATRLDVFQAIPDTPPPPLTADPRALEPAPGVTIDRLVAMQLRAGERGRVDVTLHGECFGTPARPGERTSCIDEAGVRVAVLPTSPSGALVRDTPAPAAWRGDDTTPCAVAPRAEDICVPGGAFILGDRLALEDLDRRSQPQRLRVVEPFLLDRYEMSVGRYREALRQGFVAPDATPLENPEALLTREKHRGMCTWSESPVGRESFPLTCVTSLTARALCRFFGGDLPAEDQWEFAATAAGRDVETPYPWGRELPTCERTVYGRTESSRAAVCAGFPIGPLPVNDPLLENGDRTSLGIVGLAGNVSELLATPFVPYSDVAWTRAGLRRPLEEEEAPLRAARGADWSDVPLYTVGSSLRAEPSMAAFDNVGFRCARGGR